MLPCVFKIMIAFFGTLSFIILDISAYEEKKSKKRFLLPQDFLDGTKSRTDFKAPNLIMDIIVAYGGSLPKMKIKG